MDWKFHPYIPERLQYRSRWTGTLRSRRSFQLQQNHSYDIAQEQQIEQHRDAYRSLENVIVHGFVHPAPEIDDMVVSWLSKAVQFAQPMA